MAINNVSKIKIIAGYVLLSALLMSSLLFVHHEVDCLVNTNDISEQWTDSLITLLHVQEQNTLQLLRAINRQAQDESVSAGDLVQIIEQQDSIMEQQRVQRRVTNRRDTIVTRTKPKGFFRRLGEVFAPSRRDSSVKVETTVEFAIDTVIKTYNPADSLHQRLRQMAQAKKEDSYRAARQKQRLQRFGQQISLQIDSLLKNHETETLLRAQQEAVARQSVRQRSARTIGGIAIGAVVLSAVMIFLILRDVSRSNRYRRELEAANRRAEELLTMREQLMLTISHDFKAPLGSIIGFIDLLHHSATDKEQLSHLDNMKSSARHLLQLITQLLDFHRLELNKAEIHRTVFVPAALLEEVCHSFAPIAAAKGLKLTTEIDASLSARRICDPHRYRQIVTNLLSNALKFTDHGSIGLYAHVDNRQRVVVSISDTGCGMNSDEQQRLFKSFSRLSGAQGKEGFGLGLSIVSKLTALLEGDIQVESSEGRGSTFTVSIPMAVAPLQSQEKERQHITPTAPIGLQHLLLIDDDPIQLSVTTALLSRHGIASTACSTIDQLLDALRQQSYDLLLTDVQMPAMNGFDLLTLLRHSNIAQANSIPVMAVTARGDADPAHYRKHGFIAVIHKPFAVEELLAAYNAHISNCTAATDNHPTTGSTTPIKHPTVSAKTDFDWESIDMEKVLQWVCDESLDLGPLTALCDDDSEAAAAIRQSFYTERAKQVELLRQAFATRNQAALSAVAHKMIPVYTMIKADCLVALLKQWEQLGK